MLVSSYSCDWLQPTRLVILAVAYFFSVQCFCELERSQWLFPYKELKFEGELGSGAFGVVRKAQALSMQPGKPSTTVAVKTLKGGIGGEGGERGRGEGKKGGGNSICILLCQCNCTLID